MLDPGAPGDPFPQCPRGSGDSSGLSQLTVPLPEPGPAAQAANRNSKFKQLLIHLHFLEGIKKGSGSSAPSFILAGTPLPTARTTSLTAPPPAQIWEDSPICASPNTIALSPQAPKRLFNATAGCGRLRKAKRSSPGAVGRPFPPSPLLASWRSTWREHGPGATGSVTEELTTTELSRSQNNRTCQGSAGTYTKTFLDIPR